MKQDVTVPHMQKDPRPGNAVALACVSSPVPFQRAENKPWSMEEFEFVSKMLLTGMAS